MKISAAVVLLLALAVSVLAQAPGAAKAPAAKSSKKAGAAEKEEPPKIEGLEIARSDKGFLGLQIVNGSFKMTFYDEKKKPVAPDMPRAILRWTPKNVVGREYVVLAPGGDEHSLTSQRSIRPPYNFRLFILLTKDGAADNEATAGENYVVDFLQ